MEPGFAGPALRADPGSRRPAWLICRPPLTQLGFACRKHLAAPSPPAVAPLAGGESWWALRVALRNAALAFKFRGVQRFLCLTVGKPRSANRQAFLNPASLIVASGRREGRAMPLKLSLKPGEKFVLNGAVLANGDKRTSLVLQNKACVLREKDIMQPEEANTPARRIYLAIMMMYLDGEASEEPYNEFALRMTEFMGAIRTPSILGMCVDISRDVAQGAYYKALIACRKLFELEQERLKYEP